MYARIRMLREVAGRNGGNEMSLNKVILIGRLTADPSLRYTPNGVAVTQFTLAVDRQFSKEKETDFINCVAWGKTAENCANYIGKGSLVAVDGRIQVRTYEAKDGGKRWVTEVIAEQVRFLDRRGQGQEQQQGQATQIGEEVEFDNSEIPF
jgi:single-strand DNA-binding protein